jgi:hypothetical protein
MYGTTAQITNAAAVAAIGAAFLPSKLPFRARLALFASSALFAPHDCDLCRSFVVDAARGCVKSIKIDP